MKGEPQAEVSLRRGRRYPLLMGGVLFPGEEGARLVTLIIHPNQECAPYHNRMPQFVAPEQLDQWLSGSVEDALQLVAPVADGSIHIGHAQ